MRRGYIALSQLLEWIDPRMGYFPFIDLCGQNIKMDDVAQQASRSRRPVGEDHLKGVRGGNPILMPTDHGGPAAPAPHYAGARRGVRALPLRDYYSSPKRCETRRQSYPGGSELPKRLGRRQRDQEVVRRTTRDRGNQEKSGGFSGDGEVRGFNSAMGETLGGCRARGATGVRRLPSTEPLSTERAGRQAEGS